MAKPLSGIWQVLDAHVGIIKISFVSGHRKHRDAAGFNPCTGSHKSKLHDLNVWQDLICGSGAFMPG